MFVEFQNTVVKFRDFFSKLGIFLKMQQYDLVDPKSMFQNRYLIEKSSTETAQNEPDVAKCFTNFGRCCQIWMMQSRLAQRSLDRGGARQLGRSAEGPRRVLARIRRMRRPSSAKLGGCCKDTNE